MPPSSTTSVRSPSEAPYTAADRPAGPAPTMTRSKPSARGRRRSPAAMAMSASLGSSMTRRWATRRAGARRVRAVATRWPGPRRSRPGRTVRHGAAPERFAQLVGPAGPGLADDVDGVRGAPLRLGPVEEQPRDRLVELLVRRRRRTQHVVVDPPRAMASKIASPVARYPSRPSRSAGRAWRADGAGAPRPAARWRSCRRPLPGQHQGDLSPAPANSSRRVSASSGERRQTTRSAARSGRAAPARRRPKVRVLVERRQAWDQPTRQLDRAQVVPVESSSRTYFPMHVGAPRGTPRRAHRWRWPPTPAARSPSTRRP